MGRRAAGGVLVALLGVGGLCAPAPGHAQPSPPEPASVSGRWNAMWAQAVRIHRGDSVEVQKWGEADLHLEQDGATVRGTWTTSVRGRVTWQVTGTVQSGVLTLQAVERDSEDPEVAQVRELHWRATVTADGLRGTMTLLIRGMNRTLPWRPWRATRAASG